MNEYNLDITGKICPFCLLLVKKKLQTLSLGDILTVQCDHPPAATETIPRAMTRDGNPFISKILQ